VHLDQSAVTPEMIERGVKAIRKVMEAASPNCIRLDTMTKTAEIPMAEVPFETLAHAVLSAALDQEAQR